MDLYPIASADLDHLNVSGIYAITNVATGQQYIGRSWHIHRRWADHQALLLERKHHSYKLQASWEKDGPSKFRCDIVEIVSGPTGSLEYREQWWIDNLRPSLNVSPFAISREKRTALKEAAQNKGIVDGPSTLWDRLSPISNADRQQGSRAIGPSDDARVYRFIISGETWRAEALLHSKGCVYRPTFNNWRAASTRPPDWLLKLPERYPGIRVSQLPE